VTFVGIAGSIAASNTVVSLGTDAFVVIVSLNNTDAATGNLVTFVGAVIARVNGRGLGR
jgi:hypothetical protein